MYVVMVLESCRSACCFQNIVGRRTVPRAAMPDSRYRCRSGHSALGDVGRRFRAWGRWPTPRPAHATSGSRSKKRKCSISEVRPGRPLAVSKLRCRPCDVVPEGIVDCRVLRPLVECHGPSLLSVTHGCPICTGPRRRWLCFQFELHSRNDYRSFPRAVRTDCIMSMAVLCTRIRASSTVTTAPSSSANRMLLNQDLQYASVDVMRSHVLQPRR